MINLIENKLFDHENVLSYKMSQELFEEIWDASQLIYSSDWEGLIRRYKVDL